MIYIKVPTMFYKIADRRGARCATLVQRIRQRAEATLWGLLERRGRVVGAPRARCKDAVKILHLE